MRLTRLMTTTLIAWVAIGGTALAAQAPAKAAPAGAKLPAAVATAFHKAYPTATIKQVSSEREGGKLQYEIESADGTVRRDVNYLADGTLVVEELTIEASAVPAPVLAALKSRYPKAIVSAYERLTTPSSVSYELQLIGAAVKEAVIAPDGTFISPKPAIKK